MDKHRKPFKLNKFDALNIRYYIMEMVDMGYSVEQIVRVTKGDEEEITELVRIYNDFKEEKMSKQKVDFSYCSKIKDGRWSDDEMHYGSEGVENKYHYEALSPAEKKIYRKLVYEGEKKINKQR